MSWIDSHCHLGKILDIDETLRRSRAAGVSGWVQGGISPSDWAAQRKLQAKFGKSVVVALGLHPWWVAENEVIDEELKALEAELPLADALGETGLDHQPKFKGSEARQRLAFEAQLELAKRFEKPLVLHIVNAHDEALKWLKHLGPFPNSGIVHSFSSSAEVGLEYLRLGFYLSVGPAVLRTGYKTLKNAIQTLPLEKLLVETDCPDQIAAPEGILDVAKAVSEIRGVTAQTVLDQSAENARKVFGMKA